MDMNANNMNKIIELFEKVDTGTTLELIAECNGYIDGIRVVQLSRSSFTFPNELTDQEIINYLWDNQYSIYL